MMRLLRGVMRTVRGSSLVTQGAVLVLVAGALVNVSNFGFHLIISRLLGPASYGGLSALLAVMVVLQVPVSAVQVAITQRVASQRTTHAAEEPVTLGAGGLLAGAVAAAIGGCAIVAALSPVTR